MERTECAYSRSADCWCIVVCSIYVSFVVDTLVYVFGLQIHLETDRGR